MQSVTSEKTLTIGPDITWPKEFPELKLIDDVLRCGICYEYIKTCMVTPCAHSYCSVCIRRSLLYKTACPTCFEETFETGLRNNRVLDRVIELFTTIRDKLIKYLRIAAVHFNCNEQLQLSQNQTSQKNNLLDTTPKRNIVKSTKPSSTKGTLNFPPASSNSSKKSYISKQLEDILGSPVTHESVNKESDELVNLNEKEITTVPPMFLQPKVETQPKIVDITMVPCPVCNVNIPERNINVHLDNCLSNVNKPPVKSPIKVKQKRNPLPKMVWSLMAEKDLRKKLKDYGLNTQGDKRALISRIQRYIILFNSECDNDNPRPVSEIIRQVEREEKQQQLAIPNQQRLMLNKNTDPKVIEEENKKYLQDNKDNFKKLIEAMKIREGRNIKPLTRLCNRIASDDESDGEQYSEQANVKKVSETVNANEIPTTSKTVPESINLCDFSKDENESLSPVLGGGSPTDEGACNGFNSDSSDDSLLFSINKLSESNKKNPKLHKVFCDNSGQFNIAQQLLDNKLYSTNNLRERSPSPSCTVTAHTSDSEDSISILIDRDTGQDFLDNSTEITEGVPNVNSQLEDPDFVVDTEEIKNENHSEEMFRPQRKSKRKFRNSVVSDSNEKPLSPRRTRRRINK